MGRFTRLFMNLPTPCDPFLHIFHTKFRFFEQKEKEECLFPDSIPTHGLLEGKTQTFESKLTVGISTVWTRQ